MTCVLARGGPVPKQSSHLRERESFIDNLLVQIRFIIMMIRWTGLAPWEFEFPFPDSLTSSSLADRLCANADHGRENGRKDARDARVAGAAYPTPYTLNPKYPIPITLNPKYPILYTLNPKP